jgi:hypothetical protein
MIGSRRLRFFDSYPLAMLCFGLMLGLSAWFGYGALQALMRADPIYLTDHAVKAAATVLGLRTYNRPPNPNSRFPAADKVNYVRYSFADEEGRLRESESTISAILFATLKVGDTNWAFYIRGAPESSSFGSPGGIRNGGEQGSIILGVLLTLGSLIAAVFFLNRAVYLRRGYGLL